MLTSTVLLLVFLAVSRAQLDMTKDTMNFEDNIAQESQSDEQTFVQSIASKPINDGKPFYVARDPETGTLDFNVKKTVGISNDIPVNKKDGLAGGSKGHDINSLGINNFHDFLNLPVKYSSSKFVYPLISGSYANLKYQGNINKNIVSNHKNYTTLGTTTQLPKYFTHFTNSPNEYTATYKHPEPTKARTEKPTTQRLTTTPSTTQTTTTQRITTKLITTPEPSTVKYSSTIVQNSFPSTFKNKYVDSSETRKKTTIETTSSKLPETSTPPANPVKFLDDLIEKVEHQETKPTTYRPPHDVTKLSFSTSMPLLPSAFKPRDPPKNHSQKISFENSVKNPSIMSLSEIINSFVGNDEKSNEDNSIQYETANSSPVEVKRHPSSTFPPAAQTPAPVNKQQTLQQQLQNQQQFVDLPVHQQPQFPPQPSHVGFPNEQFEDYVEFENPEDTRYADQFVKYEVQKPNVNLVKFQKTPSMNNVVISPGQNSASFVLGSQQNVGSVGIGSTMGVGTSNFANNNGPMKVGQVINEEAPIRPQQQQSPSTLQANIRFPNDSEQHFDNAPIVKGIIKMTGTAENVQPPQALLQNQPQQNQQPLVFPSSVEQKKNPDILQVEANYGPGTSVAPNPSQIIFENVNDIYEKINDKKLKQEFSTNELSNNIAPGELTPPQMLTPPSPSQQRPFNRQQPQQQFNFRRPGPPRSNLPGLPNILPQFRPNAKASQGHPQTYKDVGSIRIPYQGQNPYRQQHQGPISLPKVGLPSMMGPQNPNFRRLPNRPPQFNRGNGPNQHLQSAPFDPNFENTNRRVFRVPSQNERPQHFGQYPGPPPMNERVFMNQNQMAPPGFQLKRQHNGGSPETMQMQQRPSNIPQMPDSELNKSAPPALQNQPSMPVESNDDTAIIKLEPVITLQMLQHKKSGSKLNLPPVPHDIPQDIQSPLPNNHKDEGPKDPSIYVVYPVSSSPFENRAPLTNSNNFEEPSFSSTHQEDFQLPGLSEYQNTPFSVVSHFEQEPLLMKKDKKKNSFPYHMERPSPTPDFKVERPQYGPGYDGSIYNMGETPSIHPTPNARVVNKRPPSMGEHPEAQISSKLTRVTENPIAIAYTPTEPNRNYPTVTNFYNNLHPHHHYTQNFDDKYSVPNFGGPVISEILDEKHVGYDYYHRQQDLQHHLNHGEDLDFYKENYDFQAPFQASVSVNPEVTNPYEGWSIVTQSTDTNKIDRADLHVSESSEESSTRKFDPNEFQPVFESGFQPIYSSNKVSTAPELIQDSSEVPTTFAITYSTQPEETSTAQSPTTSSVETSQEPQSREESTTKKVEKKKEIDSLEAFFESLTRDYDEDESSNKSENENSSRSSL